MIRREIQLDVGADQWLLISQVEHARVSCLLASHALGHFGKSVAEGVSEALAEVRKELIATLLHHDDGWADWETAPRIDTQHGRPLSFRELPVEESVPIWSASIASANPLGVLPAWLVAGHFAALLQSSEQHAAEPLAVEWQREVEKRREQWFAEWQQSNPGVHTLPLAQEGLRWMQLFDLWSLWLASVAPVAGERVGELPGPYQVPEHSPLVREFSLAGADQSIAALPTTARPWPLDVPRLEIEAPAALVPVAHYSNSEEFLLARRPFTARWLLVE